MKPACKNCQYFREDRWCSNSRSPFGMQEVQEKYSCNGYVQRGKKAPFGVRVAIRALREMQR